MGFGKIQDIPRLRLTAAFFMLMFFLIAVWVSPQFLLVNFTNSIPRGVYLRIPVGVLAVGDVVAYMPPDDVVSQMQDLGWLKEGQLPQPFLKYVGGISGDTYSVSCHSFSINGNFVGDVLDTDSKGRPLPKINGSYIVSEHEFLPISSDAHGFDGRYTGCVPVSRIIAKAIFIFGW